MTTAQATRLDEMVTKSGLRQADTLSSDTWEGPAKDATAKLQQILTDHDEFRREVEADKGLNRQGREQRLRERREQDAAAIEQVIAQKYEYLDTFGADGTLDVPARLGIPDNVPAALLAAELAEMRQAIRELDPVERPHKVRQAVEAGVEQGRMLLLALERNPRRPLGEALLGDDDFGEIKELWVRMSDPGAAKFAEEAREVRGLLEQNRTRALKALGVSPKKAMKEPS